MFLIFLLDSAFIFSWIDNEIIILSDSLSMGGGQQIKCSDKQWPLEVLVDRRNDDLVNENLHRGPLEGSIVLQLGLFPVKALICVFSTAVSSGNNFNSLLKKNLN